MWRKLKLREWMMMKMMKKRMEVKKWMTTTTMRMALMMMSDVYESERRAVRRSGPSRGVHARILFLVLMRRRWMMLWSTWTRRKTSDCFAAHHSRRSGRDWTMRRTRCDDATLPRPHKEIWRVRTQD